MDVDAEEELIDYEEEEEDADQVMAVVDSAESSLIHPDIIDSEKSTDLAMGATTPAMAMVNEVDIPMGDEEGEDSGHGNGFIDGDGDAVIEDGDAVIEEAVVIDVDKTIEQPGATVTIAENGFNGAVDEDMRPGDENVLLTVTDGLRGEALADEKMVAAVGEEERGEQSLEKEIVEEIVETVESEETPASVDKREQEEEAAVSSAKTEGPSESIPAVDPSSGSEPSSSTHLKPLSESLVPPTGENPSQPELPTSTPVSTQDKDTPAPAASDWPPTPTEVAPVPSLVPTVQDLPPSVLAKHKEANVVTASEANSARAEAPRSPRMEEVRSVVGVGQEKEEECGVVGEDHIEGLKEVGDNQPDESRLEEEEGQVVEYEDGPTDRIEQDREEEAQEEEQQQQRDEGGNAADQTVYYEAEEGADAAHPHEEEEEAHEESTDVRVNATDFSSEQIVQDQGAQGSMSHWATDEAHYEQSNEDSDDETLEELHPIVLAIREDYHRALFAPIPEEFGYEYPQLSSGDKAGDVESLAKPPAPLLENMSEHLANAPLSELFLALRAELGGVWDEDRGNEMVLHEKDLGLRIGEDNKHTDVLSLADLVDLHQRCNCTEPMVIFLESEEGRFVTKFNAIQRILAAAEEHSEQGDGEREHADAKWEEEEEHYDEEQQANAANGEWEDEEEEYIVEDSGSAVGMEEPLADAAVEIQVEMDHTAENGVDSDQITGDEGVERELQLSPSTTPSVADLTSISPDDSEIPYIEETAEDENEPDQYGIEAPIRAADADSHQENDEKVNAEVEAEGNAIVDSVATPIIAAPVNLPESDKQNGTDGSASNGDSPMAAPARESLTAIHTVKRTLEDPEDEQPEEDGRNVKRRLSGPDTGVDDKKEAL